MVRKFKTKFAHSLIYLMAVSMVPQQLFGQVGNTPLDHAVRVLKNIDTDQTLEWAISTLDSIVRNDSSVYAMNCLGLAYMAGIGVEEDSTKAVFWLEHAGRGGYAEAYHNLGMIFKYSKCGVKQDFERSYNYFSVGVDSGSVSCMYDKGFMLYKGLGCEQNYPEAVECFLRAADNNHSPSLYMLGLCYRNGYGVDQNTTTATDYLNRSAQFGYKDATEELLRPNAETYLHDLYSDNNNFSDIPTSLPNVSCEINDISLIAGIYQGYLVTYDWSGKRVLSEKPLMMNTIRNGSEICGAMVLGVDTVPFAAEISSDNKLVFKKGELMLYERYAKEGKVKYLMDNLVFDVWSEKICGRLNLYSLAQKEPERPMYFELRRNTVNDEASNVPNDSISISPNPFILTFNAAFNLQNGADVYARIYNTTGIIEWQQGMGYLDRGEHEVTISPTIKSGRYILNLQADKQILRTIIIKKED